ncbi:MAG: hypothetical protein M1131_01275 [Actinobacteria bacterium]|nr:hypothetical protein [Actinomycetota bacterium]
MASVRSPPCSAQRLWKVTFACSSGWLARSGALEYPRAGSLPVRDRKAIPPVVSLDDRAGLANPLGNLAARRPMQHDDLGDGWHRLTPGAHTGIVRWEQRVPPSRAKVLRLQEAPQSPGNLVLVSNGLPRWGMQERDASLPEQHAHGFTDHHPSLASPTGADQVAVNQPPSEDRLVAVGVTHRRLQHDAPKPGERLSNEVPLLPSKVVIPEGDGSISETEGNPPIIGTASSDEHCREVGEELLIGCREPSTGGPAERTSVEHGRNNGVGMGCSLAEVPQRASGKVGFMTDGILPFRQEKRRDGGSGGDGVLVHRVMRLCDFAKIR